MPDGDRLEALVFLEQFGEVISDRLVDALDVPFVDREPHERRSERLGHREGRVYGTPVVAVEVPLVEQFIVVDHQERRRPARLQVPFEATVTTAASDGLDLGSIGVVRGQLIEVGDGGRVVDGASGEPLEVLVVGLAPEDAPCQVEVRRRQIPNNDNDQGEQKERARADQHKLGWSCKLHDRHRKAISALRFCAYFRTPQGRSRPRYSDGARSLARGLGPLYPSLPVPLCPERRMYYDHPPTVPAELCLLSMRRGLRAGRVLQSRQKSKSPSRCSVGVLPHPARTEQRAADRGPDEGEHEQQHKYDQQRAIVAPHTFSPLSQHHDATQHASMHLRRVSSPNLVEGAFSELRLDGVLRSSHSPDSTAMSA